MRKIIKEVVRFVIRFIFLWTIIFAPFILCAIAENNYIIGRAIIIIALVMVFKEITK